MTTVLNAAALITSCEIETGAAGLTDACLRTRVTALVDWLNANGQFTEVQASATVRQLRAILSNRLRIAADRRRIAAISDEKIERPIFVIGYARTGTTLLHCLLAEDPASRIPQWWQTHQPSPPPGEVAVTEFRMQQAQRELDRFIDAVPGMMTMHPYWDRGALAPVEDEEIFSIDFQNAYPTLLYEVPALAVLVDAQDPAGAYRFQKEFLQHMQFNLPPRRWVLKGTYHQFNLAALFEQYPDAICIWPHRDPLEVHTSTLAISAVLYGAITDWSIDWKAFGAGYLNSVRKAVDQVLVDPLLDDERIFHVHFKDVARDPIGTIRSIYQRCGLSWQAELETRMHAWLAAPANRSDRYGRYHYSLEPFGLKDKQVRDLFADYSKRFGLC